MDQEAVSSLGRPAILAAIRTHRPCFPSRHWDHVSPEARRLVSALMARQPCQRATAEAALQHPWLLQQLGQGQGQQGQQGQPVRQQPACLAQLQRDSLRGPAATAGLEGPIALAAASALQVLPVA
jgi:serine/threonine protein kinase